MISLLNIVLGGSLLLAGRKLFWLLLGAVGFVTGVAVATRFLHGSELVTIVAAIGLGILFAVLAIFVESVAIGLAGLLGGAYVGAERRKSAGVAGTRRGAGGFHCGRHPWRDPNRRIVRLGAH